MLKVDIQIDSIEKLQKHIELLQSLAKLRGDSKLLDFLIPKFMKCLNETIDERLKPNTTNNESIDDYKNNNKAQKVNGGFIIYNHTMADISEMSEETRAKYPNGFSIAFAFEYGVGIVGGNNPKQGAWEYNVNGHEKNWVYRKNDKFRTTSGYEGFEIYRFTVEKIRKNLNDWIQEYINKSKEVI